MDEFYKRPELASYIKKKLGNAVWRIEGFENTDSVDICIDEAVMSYSHQCPHLSWEQVDAFSTKHTLKTKRIFGVIRVDFIEPVNRFAVSHTLIGLTQNLIGVAPINIAGTMPNISGDIAQFLQWRKSFQRVTSTMPQWFYNDEDQTILLYNPGAYKACAMLSVARTFETVKPNHKDWLRRMALAEAKYQLGLYRRKFEDAIQGPGGTALKLDGGKLVEEGDKEKEACQKELRAFRTRAWPQWD